MTLNDIFNQININLSIVNGVVDSMTDPYMGQIDSFYTYMSGYVNNVYDLTSGLYGALTVRQGHVLWGLLMSYHNLVGEYRDAIMEIKSAVDNSFTLYYTGVTYQIKEALAFIYVEQMKADNEIRDLIAQVDMSAIQDLETEIDNTESLLTNMVNTLESWTGVQLSGLLETVTTTASTIYDYVGETVAGVYTQVTEWVDELWGYVESVMDWIQDEFAAYYEAIHRWIAEKATEIYGYVTDVVDDLVRRIDDSFMAAKVYAMRMYDFAIEELNKLESTLRSWVQTGLDEVQRALVAVESSMRSLIQQAKEEVQSMLSDLSILSDWRFQFLNIFMSYPELSFLQVLTRNETVFQKFKPYWQALFTRIMEPD